MAQVSNLFTLPGGGVLRADAAASYLRMRAAGMPAGGVAVFHRSLAKQEQLFKRFLAGTGPLAAKPNKNAPHVRGMAMDLVTGGKGPYKPSTAHVWLTEGGDGSKKPQSGEKLRAHAFGWRRTVPSERWHFGYNPAGDTKRAADLEARLETLQFADVTAFQTAQELEPDGQDGPLTWKALLSLAPGAGALPAMGTSELKFRFGQAAFLAALNGLPDDDSARGAFLTAQMACSVFALTGVPERARTALRDALGGQNQWRVFPVGDSTVLWNTSKWVHIDRDDLSFDPAGPAGAVRAQLSSRSSGRMLDVIAVQVRAASAFPSETDAVTAQRADLQQVVDKLRRAKLPTLVAGDLGSDAASEVLEAGGFTRASGAVAQGGDPRHQVWISSGVAVRSARGLDDPIAANPSWMLQLTLPKL